MAVPKIDKSTETSLIPESRLNLLKQQASTLKTTQGKDPPVLGLTEEVGGYLDEASHTSEVPPPVEQGGDLRARASWVEERLGKYEALSEAASKLEAYVNQTGNAQGQELLQKVHRVLDGKRARALQSEYEGLSDNEWLSDQDLDGDGVANIEDPDMDGDGLTDAFERSIGTSYADEDTDKDKITDRGELALKENFMGFKHIDPLDPDADNNGVIDGLEIRENILRKLPQPSGKGTDGLTLGGDGNDAEGVEAQSEPILWSPAKPGDQVVSLSGNVTFSKLDSSLIIQTGGGDVVVDGYFGPNGEPAKKLYIRGAVETVTFHNLNPDAFEAVADEDGFAKAGVHFESAPAGTSSTYDVFNGAYKFEARNGEVQYDATQGLTGTLEVPGAMNGQDVKRVKMTREGQDIVLSFESKSESALGKVRLKNGLSSIDSQNVTIKLGDQGILFDGTDLSFRLTGGSGNDYVMAAGGTIDLGAGHDTFVTSVSDSSREKVAIVHGGDGMDILEGGSKADQLYGDAGNDILVLGGTDGVMNGGAGDDSLVGKVLNGNYLIDGAGGIDMTNILGVNPQTGIEIDQRNVTIETMKELLAKASGKELEALQEGIRLAEIGQTQASDAVLKTVLFGLNKKLNDLMKEYTEAGDDELHANVLNDLTPKVEGK